tara:strand:+ start:19595 stop:20119 length:525 start_codon:yes stop_codon:yes gene_type:complete
MASNIGPMISASARLGIGYVERLLKDVTPENFARLAKVGDTTIESNHPAFILGHLSLYACRVIDQVGQDATAYEPSEAFEKVFSKDATCVDDPHGTIYPPMDEVVSAMLESYRAAADALDAADDAVLMEPNPNEAMRGKFPTKGAMMAFYVGGHVMLHVGQMSAWRRAMGLGPA